MSKQTGLPLIILFIVIGSVSPASGQQSHFEHVWRPALWYNTQDGAQLGVRYFGYLDNEEQGRFRIYSGLWLNTRFPDVPLAYDLRFEHPVSQWSAPQEELTLSAHTRYRDGLLRHGGWISKRLRTGPNDDQFLRLKAMATYYNQVDNDYLVFRNSWSADSYIAYSASIYLRDAQPGRYMTASLITNAFSNTDDVIIQAMGSWFQRLHRYVAIGIAGGSTIHTGTDTNPEWAVNLTYAPAVQWHDNNWFRSHGSLPVSGIRSGTLVTNGLLPGLRGYSRHDINRFETSDYGSISSIHVISTELEIANPLDLYLRGLPVAGFFAHFKTRLFADAAIVEYRSRAQNLSDNLLANAGAGLLLYVNLPDYIANERGFTIRWDVPFWVSDPVVGQDNFAFRNQLSFDIIIPF